MKETKGDKRKTMGLNRIESTTTWGTKERSSFEPDYQQTETSEATINFSKWHGQYRNIAELQGVIDRLAMWVIYGGDDSEATAEADIKFENEAHRKRFEKFTGNGKDTPEEVLFNLFRMGKICGTSMGEMIRTSKSGIINIKPLDPSTIKIKQKTDGSLEKFQQIQYKYNNKTGKKEEQVFKEIQLDKMFYIAWNRIADEITGIPTGEKLQKIIDWRHQAMEDLADLFHRYVKPFWVFYVDTDDDTEIKEFNQKVEDIFNKKGKNHITIPHETVQNHERLAVPQFSTLDPLNWIKHLERYFLISEGVPELISGIGRETADASARMIYLSWRIIAIANQKMFEKHIYNQTGIKLKLPRPVNILAPEITGDRSEQPTPDNEEGNKQNG